MDRGVGSEMRFVMLSTNYHEFTRWLHAEHPGLEHDTYQQLVRVAMESHPIQDKPDVLFNLNMGGISSTFLKEMRPHMRLLMAQHGATPLSAVQDFGCYDPVRSSFPPTVEHFPHGGFELSRIG